MRIVLLFLPFCLVACASPITLQAPDPISGCALVVIDTRPDVESIYIDTTTWIGRAKIQPSGAETLRRHACTQLSDSMRQAPLTFKITNLHCTVTGFFEMRYVADLRGHLEMPGMASTDLQADAVMLSHDGRTRTECAAVFSRAMSNMANEISRTAVGQPSD